MSMTSSRPYLVRALYDWILDNRCTPHILVYADAEGVDVPREHVQGGQVVLNIDPTAIRNLLMDKQAVSFSARFSGKETDIYIPMQAIMGIITRETGQGMMFDFMEPPSPPDDDQSTDSKSSKAKTEKPTLRVVK